MTKTRQSILKLVILDPLFEKKGVLVQLIFSLLLMSLGQSLFLFIIGPFLKTLFGLGLERLTLSGRDLFTQNILQLFPSLALWELPKERVIQNVSSGLFLAASLKAVASYSYQLSASYLSLHVAKVYRDRLFSGLLSLSYVEISKKSAAEWMSLLMNDVLFLQTRFSEIVNSIVRDSTILFAALLTLFFIHWPTALLILICSPAVAFGMGRTGKKISFFADLFQKELAHMADLILEIRKRFYFIKAQQGEKKELLCFEDLNSGYYHLVRRSILIRSIFAPLLEFIGYALLATVIYLINVGFISQEGMDPVNIVIFFASLGAMLQPLRSLGEQIVQWEETRGSLRKSFQVLSSFAQKKKEPIRLQDSKRQGTFNRDISIKRLVSGFLEPRLEAHHLHLGRGHAIALVGPSGSGKSTLLRTLAGLLPPFEWQSDTSLEELVENCSFVSQSPFLFDDSLCNNLLYGQENKEGREDLSLILDLVGIGKEVSAFAQGLDTRIVAIRSNISGGQKQRLVLARALLRHKTILLLDEVTSAIDARSEEEILKRSIEFCHTEQKIILAVTHRLHTLAWFDEVWFLEEGQMRACGTHEELLKQERYRSFYESAF